jgi:hypothetical protein
VKVAALADIAKSRPRIDPAAFLMTLPPIAIAV